MTYEKIIGYDGIPIEFFKVYSHIVGEGFYEITTNILERDEFHQAMTKGVINLIP